MTKHGVRHRLRLLYKSHIDTSATLERQLKECYACLFCVQTGSTVRDGDATVFQTADALLLHLARHPQPLPAVPGVNVLYGTVTDSDPHALDFDLHFTEPPQPVPIPENVVRAAVAIASENHIQKHPRTKLKGPSGYDGEMLQFLAGARIVGLSFPEKWEGKWCLGRHDGSFGAFPAKAVDVQPPSRDEIPLESGHSGMSVTARWKWKPKSSEIVAAGTWLEFGKGEVISNVRCKSTSSTLSNVQRP
jgi:hypothetical protein